MTNSKQKGKRLELEASKAVNQHWGAESRRSQQFNGQHEEGEPDLVNVLPGVHVEVKGRKQIACLKWLRQAERDVMASSPSRTPRWPHCPIVLMREDGDTEWVMMMRVSDVPSFVRCWQAGVKT